MPKLKELFSTPKKAAVTVACIGVILVTLGVCIVVYAAGGSAPQQSTAIGGENAQSFAFADAGVDPVEAQAVSVKYASWQGQFVYEVEFIAGDTEYEYKIDASDGSVLKKESKTVKGPEASAALPAAVTLEEARETALADAGLTREEATFTKAEADEEGGVSVYEFEFYAGNVKHEYEINARTGAIYSKGTTTYVGQGQGASASAPPAPTAQATAPVGTAAPSAPRPSAPPSAAPQPSSGIVPPSPNVTAPSGQFQGSGQTQITLDEAKAAALADAGLSANQVVYKEAKLDREDGTAVYEIEFYTADREYEYEIDAATGAVYSRKTEAVSAAGGHGAGGHHSGGTGASDGFISEEQARSAALGHAGFSAGEVTFAKTELDYEDNMYEVEFYKDGLEYEYEINALTGAVAEYSWDHHHD